MDTTEFHHPLPPIHALNPPIETMSEVKKFQPPDSGYPSLDGMAEGSLTTAGIPSDNTLTGGEFTGPHGAEHFALLVAELRMEDLTGTGIMRRTYENFRTETLPDLPQGM